MSNFSLNGFDVLYLTNESKLPPLAFNQNTIMSQVAQLIEETLPRTIISVDEEPNPIVSNDVKESNNLTVQEETFLTGDDELNLLKEVEHDTDNPNSVIPKFDTSDFLENDADKVEGKESFSDDSFLDTDEEIDKKIEDNIDNNTTVASEGLISKVKEHLAEFKDLITVDFAKIINIDTNTFKNVDTEKLAEQQVKCIPANTFSKWVSLYSNYNNICKNYEKILLDSSFVNDEVSNPVLNKLLQQFKAANIVVSDSLVQPRGDVSIDTLKNKGWTLPHITAIPNNVKKVIDACNSVSMNELDHIFVLDIFALVKANNIDDKSKMKAMIKVHNKFVLILSAMIDTILRTIYATTNRLMVAVDKSKVKSDKPKSSTEQLMISLESLMNSPEQTLNMSEVHNSAALLSHRLNQMYTTINGPLHTKVTELHSKIETARDNYLRDQGNEVALDNMETPVLNATIVSWKEISALGSANEILETTKRTGNIKSENLVTITNAKMTIKNWVNTIETIIIPDDVTVNVQDIITDRSSASPEMVARVYNILTNKTEYSTFVNRMKLQMNADKPGLKLPELMNIFKTYTPILNAFKQGNINISDRDTTNIQNNATNILTVLQCMGMFAIACRKLYSASNVLILSEGVVNQDTLTLFNSQGGNNEDIELHYRMRYKRPIIPIPNMGVRIDDITRQKDRVLRDYNTFVSTSRNQLTTIRNHATLYAFKQELTNYAKESATTNMPAHMTIQGYVAQASNKINSAANHIHSQNSSVEDCLYTFLLDTEYQHVPAMKTMYNKLRDKYIRLVNDSVGEISATDKSTATAEVFVDMATDFVFDTLVQ